LEKSQHFTKKQNFAEENCKVTKKWRCSHGADFGSSGCDRGPLRIVNGLIQSDDIHAHSVCAYAASQLVAIRNNPVCVEEDVLRITDGASESDARVEKKVHHTSQKWRLPQRIFNLKKMDEAEIVTLLPCVLGTLHIHSLQSILSVLTGFATRILNRNWLEERIV
jgi:hypothetical protein